MFEFQLMNTVEISQDEDFHSVLCGEVAGQGFLTHDLQVLQVVLVSSCQQIMQHSVGVGCLSGVNET